MRQQTYTRFTGLIEELLARKAEGEEVNMCEYIDMLEARGENVIDKIKCMLEMVSV